MNTSGALWPWLALAGLGLFHGINPAMGWLFAVALGLNRRSQRIVLLSLVPIALGHAAAVAAVVAAVLALGLVVDHTVLMRLAAAVLIGWAAWHAVYGHRRRVRVGMQTGLIGLALWSFLMASAHGAGLMLIPVLAPLCLSSAPAQTLTAGSVPVALAARRRSYRRDARHHHGDRRRRLQMGRRRLPAARLDQSRSRLDRGAGGERRRVARHVTATVR